jgi:hypothetical protein
MGAALAMKILEALKHPNAKVLASACSTLQGIGKHANKELAVTDIIPLAKACLISLETIEQAMRTAPTALRSELLVGAMCTWTGLEGTLAMAESKLRLTENRDSNRLLEELASLRMAGKKSGKATEALAKEKGK